MKMAQIIMGFQVFRAATVAAVVISTTLATTGSGGLLPRARRAAPGTAA